MVLSEYTEISGLILTLEREGLVTRTFRRLDPERQAAIIEAIFDEAMEDDPQNLNIKRVAERAGVSVGSLYQYFGSRQGLLDFAVTLVIQVAQVGFDQYREVLANMPLIDALRAYGSGGKQWAEEGGGGFTRFFARAAYGGNPELAEKVVRPIAATLFHIVHDMLLAAQRRGELREGIDLEATTRVIHALVIALYDPLLLPYLNTYFQIAADDCPADRTLEAAFEMIIHGIIQKDPRKD